ncbi:GNAT family N-acetyltransferase [Arthrobacter sp. STN4]|uniref:GNAT family N-acetyltransferase n=1 Tax=Arthrobacter sp. STN4 TaxID=2923276 RepID=UPI00211A6870|nr:GNAT family N-acetyltransferase [Arthrobacter sp. STN4]MCQ9163669.1 bifunctional UDP-2,4-diacetamido-2,4,6-trideoxy-beta-L-altropyranose hydrolase/GNAT family N-acetyltransferase [Arthrobacter sp. STN4]
MALADEALASGWSIEVCGDIDNPTGLEMIAARTEIVHPAPRNSDELASLALCRKANLVHIDTYKEHVGLREILNASGIPLSSMEDATNGRRAADLIVDPSPASELSFRPDDGSMRLFRGLKAIPLRRSILNLGTASTDPSEGRRLRVMIVMGGTDAKNLTNYMVQCWLDTGLDAECHVVAQPEAFRSLDANIRRVLTVHDPGPDIPRFFPEMDLIVTASGTTIWELAYLGTPMAVLQVVDNQNENYQFATSQGMAIGLGSVVAGLPPRQDVIQRLRHVGTSMSVRGTLARQAQSLVDGLGSRNIIAQWSQVAAPPVGPVARLATVDDASILFEWRNDPTVRGVSRNARELTWEGHIAWLQKVLASPLRLLFIVESGRKPIGTVRFDAHDTDAQRWEVSITIAPSLRGRGLGNAVLASGEAFLFTLQPEARLFAEMLESNEASYRLFTTAGYSGSIVVAKGHRWHSLDKK